MMHAENPFATFGIRHLSPSAIFTFIASPAMFILEKVLGERQPVGPSAHRGSAVEEGVLAALNGASVAEAVAKAEATFARLTALSTDKTRDKEAAGIAGMVEQGFVALERYGPPSATQGAVERRVEGLAVPIVGYFDFAWDHLGIVIDLKTAHAMPSAIRTTHARQAAFYGACLGDNWQPRVCYATPKKQRDAAVESPREHVAVLERCALKIQTFLSASADPDWFKAAIAPDVDHYMFAPPRARQAAWEAFGV